MPDIEIVPSPRPEPGQEPPLPTYHELLNILCDEFHVPGSPTFSEAVRYIKEHHSSTTEKFQDWFRSQSSEPSLLHLGLITLHSITPEGRERIAASYIEPGSHFAQRLMANHPRESVLGVRLAATHIENLIQCFPESERFCEPLMTLREVLIEIYSYMSPNYEAEPEYEEDPLPASARGRVSEPVTPEEPPYEGSRPTLFERLFREED